MKPAFGKGPRGLERVFSGAPESWAETPESTGVSRYFTSLGPALPDARARAKRLSWLLPAFFGA
jgi:hypothetical protein